MALKTVKKTVAKKVVKKAVKAKAAVKKVGTAAKMDSCCGGADCCQASAPKKVAKKACCGRGCCE